jgi:2-deoxy-D-gluconate 3-dehydrogenase
MSLDLFRVKGQVAIVTGGSRGIGFAIARGLALAGARVVIANRTAAQGEAAAAAIERDGGEAIAIPTDIRDGGGVETLVAQTLDAYDRLDVLVNNAAVMLRREFLETTAEELQRVVADNYLGHIAMTQAAGREMVRRRRGKVITLSSVGALIGLDQRGIYGGLKAGLAALTRSLAVEWAPHNVQVNAIAPGFVRTPMNAAHLDANPERLKGIVAKIPAGRIGAPEDLVGAALFLASPASDYVTGHLLVVDGGWSIS